MRQSQGERRGVRVRLGEPARQLGQPLAVSGLKFDMTAGDQPLQLGRGALGDQSASVEHTDPVGELIGLLQVLGGEKDGDPVGH
ncbi:hypothetical protein [Streptomyces phaeochromogenes]|uniref:hypothetical protein n=1 Tax=Streptomyces phaeochromogenes TaxID=1923 RepID=UPI0039A3DE60